MCFLPAWGTPDQAVPYPHSDHLVAASDSAGFVYTSESLYEYKDGAILGSQMDQSSGNEMQTAITSERDGVVRYRTFASTPGQTWSAVPGR